MELLFTWIESYRNIKNQGINFSSEFNISFDNQKGILSLEKKQTYIPDFFGDKISNISVIVGENGTGKTSILHIEEATFYLGRKDNNYFLVCGNSELLERIIFDERITQNIKKHKEFNFADTLIINYSNFIDGSIDDKRSGLFPFSSFYDLSTNTLVRQVADFDKTSFDDTSLFNDSPFTRQIKSLLSEIGSQLSFLLKDNNHEKLKFKTPEILSVEFNIDSELEYLRKLYEDGGGFGDEESYRGVKVIIDCFLKKHLPKQFKKAKNNNIRDLELNVDNKTYALFLLRWSMFLSFINSFSSPNIDADGPDRWLRFDDAWKNQPIEDWFIYFFTDYIIQENNYISSKQDAQIHAWAANAITFVKHFEELLVSKLVTFEISKYSALYSNIPETHGLALTLKIDISSKDYREFLYERLIANYQNIQDPLHWRNDNRGFLSFSWRGISTGEIAIFRLLSRFNNLSDSIKKRKEIDSPIYRKGPISNLLFLIDEGEIGLHPAWQKQFLSILIDNLPLMFEDLGVESIQIILTTHSPFVLSDIPNNHIIFLEKNEKGECIVNKNPLQDKRMTFGANIHSLLSDSFFMKEGLMGDFAKRKINQLIDDLMDSGMKLSSQKKQEIQAIIPIIGEPIIRKKIFDLFNEKINLSIDDRIKLLEESKERLEKDILMLKTKRDDSDNKS